MHTCTCTHIHILHLHVTFRGTTCSCRYEYMVELYAAYHTHNSVARGSSANGEYRFASIRIALVCSVGAFTSTNITHSHTTLTLIKSAAAAADDAPHSRQREPS